MKRGESDGLVLKVKISLTSNERWIMQMAFPKPKQPRIASDLRPKSLAALTRVESRAVEEEAAVVVVVGKSPKSKKKVVKVSVKLALLRNHRRHHPPRRICLRRLFVHHLQRPYQYMMVWNQILKHPSTFLRTLTNIIIHHPLRRSLLRMALIDAQVLSIGIQIQKTDLRSDIVYVYGMILNRIGDLEELSDTIPYRTSTR
mmetsp:Transcript_21754/g.33086  ORF Transcript_21754/g.33086 Transcript_21754/m.33086 type:complete len:201 (-) Transcript_21754:3599-4201(-)